MCNQTGGRIQFLSALVYDDRYITSNWLVAQQTLHHIK
jgi:hypothetical protein